MGFLNANFTVGHMVWSPGTPDPFGNSTPAWAAPVDLLIYGMAPGGSETNAGAEPVSGRMAVSTTLQLLVPPENAAGLGPHDRYVVDGETWEQDGILLDYTRGPFDWFPGVVVNLKKVGG